MIASLADVKLALIVTEPTLSGIHDMMRIADVAKHFKVEHKVVINKYDINLENTSDIEKICQNREIEVVGKLPFSDAVNKALVAGVPVVEFCQDKICKEINNVWSKIN